MKLPIMVDKTPNGKIVERSGLGCQGYAENVEYQLEIKHGNGYVVIEYYGEDGTTLSENEINSAIRLANRKPG